MTTVGSGGVAGMAWISTDGCSPEATSIRPIQKEEFKTEPEVDKPFQRQELT